MIDRRLLVLRAVAAHGTITTAADTLHLTPSAVSHQLRQLARELGVRLLEPSGRNIVLTPAAHTLLAHVDVLAAQCETARADLASHRAGGGLAGPLRLCGFSTAAAAFLPAAAARLARDHPHLSIQVAETEPGPAFDRLLSGQADIAVVAATSDIPPANDPRFDQQPLFDEPLDLLVPRDHPCAGRDAIALPDVSTDAWIVGPPGGAYHQLIVTACAAAGFTPHIAHLASEWDTGAALVAHGFGIAPLPRLARIPDHPHAVRIPMTGQPRPIRHILTATRAGSHSHPAIAASLQALDEIARSEP